MSADAKKRTAGDSDDGVRLESERKVIRNPSGSPPGTPGRAGKGRDTSTQTAGRARGSGGSTGLAATDRIRESEAKSKAIWDRNMTRARERFPNAPQTYLPILAAGIHRLERKGNPSDNAAVIAWVKSQGYPVGPLA